MGIFKDILRWVTMCVYVFGCNYLTCYQLELEFTGTLTQCLFCFKSTFIRQGLLADSGSAHCDYLYTKYGRGKEDRDKLETVSARGNLRDGYRETV